MLRPHNLELLNSGQGLNITMRFPLYHQGKKYVNDHNNALFNSRLSSSIRSNLQHFSRSSVPRMQYSSITISCTLLVS